MANWLNLTFYNFDKAVFCAMHNLAKNAGGFFTPFAKVLSVFGEGGLFFIALAIALMLFKSTRRVGFTVLLAVGVGALFTNVIIKNAVARPRPFTQEEYKPFWEFVSAKRQSEFSFPSGHVTVTTTSMVAIGFSCKKKLGWLCLIAVPLMAFSRVYLIVHYTTDVLGGVIIGGLAGTIAHLISRYIFKVIENHPENKFCKFVLNASLIKKK